MCTKVKIKEMFTIFCKQKLNSNTGMDKLTACNLFEHLFGIEKYLEILPDRKQRKALTAFRISSHKLQIQRGRYSGQQTEERLCNACNVML